MQKIKLLMVLFSMVVATSFGFMKIRKASATQPSMNAATAPGTAPEMAKPPATHKNEGIFSKISLADIIATLIYSLLGLVVALFGYKVYDWVTPFDLRKELEIDQNTSLGIVAGSIILGLCIIIAASIMSP